jgi:hypothetical protein
MAAGLVSAEKSTDWLIGEVPAPLGLGAKSGGAGAKDLTSADRLQSFAIVIVIVIRAAKRPDSEDSQIVQRRCDARPAYAPVRWFVTLR